MTKQMTKKCLVCGKEFEPPRKDRVCCSQECTIRYRKNKYKYNPEHKEKIKNQSRQRYIQNKNKAKEYYKQYYSNNREVLLEKSKAYRQQHREYYKEYSKIWEQQNKKYYNNTCIHCNTTFKTTKPKQKFCSEKCKQEYHELQRQIKINNKPKKNCVICGKEFTPRNTRIQCCSKECTTIYNKQYYSRNREKILNQNKQYQAKHKEKYQEYRKIYNEQQKVHHDRICTICGTHFTTTHSRILTCSKECQKKYERIKDQEYLNKRYKENIPFRISVLIRGHLKRCFRFINTPKDVHTFELLGYTPQELKQCLEKQFYNGMTWDNYGTYWEIHHIKPLHTFNFGTIDNVNYEQIKIANSLDNLQALTIQDHKLIHQC